MFWPLILRCSELACVLDSDSLCEFMEVKATAERTSSSLRLLCGDWEPGQEQKQQFSVVSTHITMLPMPEALYALAWPGCRLVWPAFRRRPFVLVQFVQGGSRTGAREQRAHEL